ncbi:Major facilitator superfamily MFS-1 domain containing protein [Trichostrongylus colubriformis]|uniref:Major facilitator superfamily MFS-1 domain containing protein n=1 Tax=Trichostrongylus colubriformis TaxID=6319 RepID=A0AAN8ICB1_TRICO
MAGDSIDIDQYNATGSIFQTLNGTYYEDGNSSYLLEYDEAVLARRRYAYSSNEKNTLFSFVAIGAMVAVYPVMWLIQKFGTRSIVTIFGFLSAICTALIPLCAHLGFYWMVVMRFLQIGPIFTMPVAGALCTSSLGWSSVYYLHAIITCILFLLFLYFYREQPQMHACVSAKELDRIKRNKGDTNEKQPLPVKVMGFPVEQTGLYSAIPQIVTFVVKMVAGLLADKATCCQPVTSVKIFNLIAVGGMGITFFILAFIPTSMPIFGLVILIICTSIIGFNCGAFFRSSAIVAAQHNHFVMGVNSFLNCLAALLAPVVVNIFVRNDTWDEWWYVWIVHGIVMIISNAYFMFFGKGEPAEWTKPGYGVRVAPLGTPPRSHPREGRFSMRLNDKISVSVQTAAMSRCDTCRGNRPVNNRAALPAIAERKADTSSMFDWGPQSIKEAFDSLEDYLDTEPHRPPRSNERKIITPSSPDKK